ncbi:hypothetical protein CS544_01195 [Porphyromonas gingivalis]|uniref:Uncharacterized protein n=1 Tax=Porphyromonas gingivalis F0570 TaxID=1227271 RepID=A0A0E2LQ99_PORGN|nr:hypothetical protein CS544_01195 [Porphyromonas gingivalis]EOA11797.1 hypothetical protein A343_1107 [Porphyromonas gingivalis JCVI SC001]ERJ65292.1 hypothetical protein HMPREF1555_01432 [Porphyromonas gingivalis F0570]ATS01145.1 hypothetical protein CS549_08830 [Porphyromonas gingivalis]ATS02960.1 hypothetical protein CS059_08250 [Porphyromonas gingivalis]
MKRLTPIGLLEKEQVRFVGLALSFFVPNLGSEAYPEHTVIPPFGGLDPKRKTQGSLIEFIFYSSSCIKTTNMWGDKKEKYQSVGIVRGAIIIVLCNDFSEHL